MAAEEATHAGDHAAEAGGAFPPFDASLFASQLVWFVISFGALYVLLSRLVLPQISAVLARRASAISGDLEQAAKKSAAAEDARAAMEKAIAKARAESRAMIDKARAEVQAKLGAEQELAEARLTTRVHAAEAQVNAARAKALAEVPAMADALARDIADKLAGARA
jgi:F-type H+-transporting ATPase subunit b